MTERRSEFGLSGNSIVGAIVGIIALIGIYFVAGFIISILYKWALLLLIPAAIIDYKVITGYFKWLGRLTRKNTGAGVAAIVFSALFYPFVSIFLLGKALFKRRIKQAETQAREQREGEFIEYEEVQEEKPLELPDMEKPEQETPKSDYEKLF